MKPYQKEVEEARGKTMENDLDKLAQQEDQEDAELRSATPVADEEPESQEEIEVIVSDEPEPIEKPPEAPNATEILGQLVEVLRPPVEDKKVEIPKRPDIEVPDVEAIKKEFNDKLHQSEDPFSVSMEANEKIFGPTLARQAREIQSLKKDAMKADPDKAFILNEYGADVETVVANLPKGQQNHPDVYIYAVNQVMLEHMDDLVDRRVEESIKKRTAKTVPGANKTIGNPTSNPKTTRTKKVVRASRSEEAMATKYGLSVHDYLVSINKIQPGGKG